MILDISIGRPFLEHIGPFWSILVLLVSNSPTWVLLDYFGPLRFFHYLFCLFWSKTGQFCKFCLFWFILFLVQPIFWIPFHSNWQKVNSSYIRSAKKFANSHCNFFVQICTKARKTPANWLAKCWTTTEYKFSLMAKEGVEITICHQHKPEPFWKLLPKWNGVKIVKVKQDWKCFSVQDREILFTPKYP